MIQVNPKREKMSNYRIVRGGHDGLELTYPLNRLRSSQIVRGVANEHSQEVGVRFVRGAK